MPFSVDEVMDEIDRQAKDFGVDPTVAKALALAENTADGRLKKGSWNNNAVSDKGAQGIMQVMPDTASGLQKAGLLPTSWKYDPDNLPSQVSAGLAAIKDVSSRAKNPSDPYEIAAGYNGSPAVQRNYQAGSIDKLPTETRGYFTKVRNALMDLDPNSTNVGAPVTDNSGGKSGTTTTTSTSGSTRTRVGDQGTMDQLLSDGFNLVQPGGVLDQTAAGVVGAAGQRNDAFTNLFSAIVAKSKAAGESAAAETAVQTAEATRRALILTNANLTPDVAGNLMDTTMRTINDTDEALRPMKKAIDEKMSVGFFDNPLMWMVNQTRLPGMVGQYNAVATTQNAAIDKFKNVAAAADAEQKLATGIDADLIQRKGVARAAEAAATANAELSKAQTEAATANSRDYLTLAQIAMEKLGAGVKLFGATSVVKTETQGQTEKATQAAQDQANLDNVNRLITAAGGNGVTLAQFKMMSAKQKEDYIQLASTGKFGKDFSDSFSFQDSVGNRRELARKGGLSSVMWMDQTQQAAMTVVKDEAAKWEKMNTGKLMTGKQKEEMMSGALNQVQTRYESEYRNDMRGVKDGNPYKLSYDSWAKLPELANNPMAIFINTYGPQGKEPVFAQVDEKYILDRFSTSIQKSTMSVTDAAKAISDFYKISMQKQAITTAYPLYGLNPGTAYNVNIPPMGLMSRGPTSASGKLDMSDPKQVENFLTRNVATRSVSENMNAGAVFNITQ